MFKTAFTALAGTLIAAASPAFADIAKPDAEAVATSTAAPAAMKAAKPARYCVVEKITGSNLPQRHCQTREEWLASGFDPLAK